MKRALKSLKRSLRGFTNAKPKFLYKKRIFTEVREMHLEKADTYIFATNTAGNWALLSVDILLALGLKAVGKNIAFVICDKVLPACQMCEFDEIGPNSLYLDGAQRQLCKSCHSYSEKLLLSLGIKTLQLSSFIKDPNSREPIDIEVKRKLSQHATAGLLRYLGKGDLESCTPEEIKLLALFNKSAQISYEAFRVLIRQIQPKKIILHHGIYIPQGSALQACKDESIPAICWSITYRKQTILLTHGDTHHNELPAETASDVFNFEFNAMAEEKIDKYLISREKGVNDWISFSKRVDGYKNRTLTAIGLDPGVPTFLLLTNVMWDAKLHFTAQIYKDMMDWILDTIKIFQKLENHQLVIRVHPAELTGTIKSRQKVIDEICSSGLEITPNIVIVDAHDQIHDTYWLIDKCHAAIVFGSKAAIEIAARGKHVVVVGNAWCRNKGFTIDPVSVDDYHDILVKHDFLKSPEHEIIRLAKKYAYYIFFRRMICIEKLIALPRFSPLVIDPKISSVKSLQKDQNLMKIINAIISGNKFEFD